jgi:hypothetical protein
MTPTGRASEIANNNHTKSNWEAVFPGMAQTKAEARFRTEKLNLFRNVSAFEKTELEDVARSSGNLLKVTERPAD